MDVIQPTPTSRLCVKNLPKHVDEPRLKEHFSSKGEVTDVKIIRTKDGKSRMFGFVGYKTDQAAQAAQKFFDRTFFDTSRISVEYARKVGDSEVRPWSKYSDGSSKHQKLAEQQNATTDGSKDKNGKKGSAAEPAQEDVDEKFAEFLQLMQPRSKSKLWSNDTMMSDGVAAGKQAAPGAGKAAAAGKAGKAAAAAAAGKAAAAAGKAAARKAAAGDELSSDDEAGTSDDENDYQDLAAGQQGRAADADASQGSEDADEDEDEDEQQPKVDSGNDLDYLKSRMTVKSFDDDDDDAFLQRAGVPGAGAAAEPSAPSDDPEADKMESDDADADEDEAGSSDVDSDTDLQHDAAARGDQSGVGTSAAATSKQQAKAAKLAAAMGIELPEAPEAEAADMDVDAPQQEQQQPPQQQAGRGDVIAADDAVSIIQDTGRLFLRNLAYSATETDLTELFSTFGPVEEAHVVLDKLSKHSKGIAYVLFRLPEDAVRAFQELDGQIFQGRLLHILPARKPPSQEAPAQAAGKDGSFKDKREQERKGDAGNRSVWNTLFLRQDTVAEAIAAHYGITKAQLLDRDAEDLPVRMALGEAQVIAQTKQALGDAGVDIAKLEAAAAASGKASLNKSVARSGSVLLLKNLPWATNEEELLDLCSSCGAVARLVLPPTKTLALVEFLEAAEARAAFKTLAYRKFHHVPLYVEWAPSDIFALPPPAEPLRAAQVQAKQKAQASGKVAKAGAAAEAMAPVAAAEDEDSTSSTIYVKNLAFSSTEAGLEKHFGKAVAAAGGQLLSAKVARRKGDSGQLLSQGYGFVECSSEEVARAVVAKLQGSSLDGHQLALQISKRKAEKPAKESKAKAKPQDGEGAKLVVRNVAFEATRKDIQGLFAPFGHLRSCRLPKKFDGNHRGFAFVEFVTKQEARNAMEGVGGVHLYGRRLVVEYAKEEEGLDELRAKTGAKFRGDDEAAEARHKRLKIA